MFLAYSNSLFFFLRNEYTYFTVTKFTCKNRLLPFTLTNIMFSYTQLTPCFIVTPDSLNFMFPEKQTRPLGYVTISKQRQRFQKLLYEW